MHSCTNLIIRELRYQRLVADWETLWDLEVLAWRDMLEIDEIFVPHV